MGSETGKTMLSNDVFRRLRYTLNLRNRETAELCARGGLEVSEDDIQSYLLRDDEEGFVECSTGVLTAFLDGLIVHLRGEREAKAGAAPKRVMAHNNNRVLRKLRIAFDLKDEDMMRLLELGGFSMSKPELSALFRAEKHKHFRKCGDQVLRYFIVGLTKERRPEVSPEPEGQDEPVPADSLGEPAADKD